MLTVHALGGTKMLAAAVEAAHTLGSPQPPRVLAVTVLTSMDEPQMNSTGVPGRLVDQVIRLTSDALASDCAGVVSSARETKLLRERFGNNFLIANPGIRPSGDDPGDQARTVTPAEAIINGASHIVVGRPITAAKGPLAAACAIREEIRGAAARVGSRF